MIWKRRSTKPTADEEARAVRRLLETAADPVERREPPPFFAARVRARAAAELEARAGHPFGVAARQVLPVLAVMVMALTAWTGYEAYEAAETRSEVLERTLSDPSALDEAVMVALLLDAGGQGAGE